MVRVQRLAEGEEEKTIARRESEKGKLNGYETIAKTRREKVRRSNEKVFDPTCTLLLILKSIKSFAGLDPEFLHRQNVEPLQLLLDVESLISHVISTSHPLVLTPSGTFRRSCSLRTCNMMTYYWTWGVGMAGKRTSQST